MADADLCRARTRAGASCTHSAVSDSRYCYLHKPAETIRPSLNGTSEPDADFSFDDFGDDDIWAELEDLGDLAEDEPSPKDLRQQLKAEFGRFIERLQAMDPAFVVPEFSAETLSTFLQSGIGNLIPNNAPAFLKGLPDLISPQIFDIETYKGLWFLINYSLQSKREARQRRRDGQFETDPWGMDEEFLDALMPLAEFLYRKYWRVQTTGLENIPEDGRALLIANHAGQLPFDGMMVATAIHLDHPTQRLVRTLYASWVNLLPFMAMIFNRSGQALATVENGTHLLENEQLVAVFPEGFKGSGKLYKDRYQLARFGRGGFVRMALRTGAPIIPVSIVGSEEIYITLRHSQTIARLFNLPYFPMTLRFPWLGPLGAIPYPTKWSIQFGKPISMERFGKDSAENLVLVSQLSNQVRSIVQKMTNNQLKQRQSLFRG